MDSQAPSVAERGIGRLCVQGVGDFVLKRLPPAVLMVIAFLGPLLFGLVLMFVTELIAVPSFKKIALWLTIGLAAASLSKAAAAKRWFERSPPFIDVGIRIIVTIVLFFLFIFLFGGWGLAAQDAGMRARDYLHAP